MGLAIETVGGKATSQNVVNAVTAFAAATGESFIPGSFPRTSPAFLEMLVGNFTAENTLRVRGPSLHDNEQAIHFKVLANDVNDLLTIDAGEPVLPQENVLVEYVEDVALIAAAQTCALRYYYEDLDGAEAKLVSPGDVKGQVKHILSVRCPTVLAGVAGTWASREIDITEDSLHSDSKYAVLGYKTDLAVTCVAIHGPDTSNYRVGGPGLTDAYKTAYYFAKESERFGTPHIPLIDPKNRGATYVDVLATAIAGTANVELILAELPGS